MSVMSDIVDTPQDTPEVIESVETSEEPVVEEPDDTPEVSEEEALENSKNPERTAKYIEKLKTERDSYKNVLESLKPEDKPIVQEQTYTNLNQGQIDDVVQSMIDKDGYLDGVKLSATLTELNARLQRAEQTAKKAELTQRDFEEKQVMREVHTAYPTLDPNGDAFDADFFDAVRNEMIGQMMEGHQDPMGAAKKWHEKLYNSNMTKEEKREQVQKEDAKRAINAVGTRATTMTGYWENEKEEDLRASVRAGKEGALAELLRRRNS